MRWIQFKASNIAEVEEFVFLDYLPRDSNRRGADREFIAQSSGIPSRLVGGTIYEGSDYHGTEYRVQINDFIVIQGSGLEEGDLLVLSPTSPVLQSLLGS